MNQLDLLARWDDSLGGDRISVLIDGTDLIEMVRDAERQHATAEGHPELAGGYGGLSREEWLEALERMEGRIPVLSCECGETGCWALEAKITTGDGTVAWSDFGQPHRKNWFYPRLGPFRFEEQAYARAIAALAGLREA